VNCDEFWKAGGAPSFAELLNRPLGVIVSLEDKRDGIVV